MKSLFLIRTLSLSFVSALVPAVGLAQDTQGQNQEQTGAGTVVRGKAPVAKELLKVRFPKPKTFRLKDGLSVYVLEDHRVPSVRFSLQIHAGTLFEDKPGVANMTASMLTEGAGPMDFLAIAEATENVGASLSASAGPDTATISTSGLSESEDSLLDLLIQVVLHPTFPQDRLDRARSNRGGGGGRGRGANPAGMLSELSSKVFYGGTPYARSAPTREQSAAITRADLVAFHEKFYRPNGAILGVTGDVDPKQLRAKLETAFADWRAGNEPLSLPPASFKQQSVTHVYLIDRPGSTQTVLQFGAMAVKQSDPDFIPLTVANRILGGGSSGRLFQNIREQKGYTYGAYSSLSGGQWPGIWGANASVRTEVTAPAVSEFFKEFTRLQDQLVPADELERAKRSIVGSFARTLESPEGILGRTLELVQNGLPMNYWDTYPAKIQAVTPAEVQRVAKKYLSGGRIQVFAVGERKEIEAGLARFGELQVVDASKVSTFGGN